MKWRWLAAILFVVAAAAVLLWVTRAYIAGQIARAYFQQHGIASTVEIGELGLTGVSGRFTLGPADRPDVSADRIELRFDPLRWAPFIVDVRLVNPVIRARVDANGKVTLASLQQWIESLQKSPGQSRYVSDDLTVSLFGLRLLLDTPAGPVTMRGDVRLAKNLPVSAALELRPATLNWRGTVVAVKSASLNFDKATRWAQVHFSGSARNQTAAVEDVKADLSTSGLVWNGLVFTTPSLHLAVAAHAANGASDPRLDVIADHVSLSLANGLQGAADLRVSGSAGLATKPARSGSALTDDAIANLAQLKFDFAGHVARRGQAIDFALTAPLIVTGAKGAVLNVPALALKGSPDHVTGKFNATLAGGGMPPVHMAARRFTWADGALTVDTALNARFDIAAFRSVVVDAQGALSWRSNGYAFAPSACAHVALAALHPGDSDLARDVRGTLCAVPGQKMITGKGANWTFEGAAREASALLPLATVRADSFAARLSFAGKGSDFSGTAVVQAGQISDGMPVPRFLPMSPRGTAALQGGVWKGIFAVADNQKDALGEVTFSHTLADGSGMAHIDAAHLVFAPGKFQPETISPLLAAFRRAQGAANFQGDIHWSHGGMTSNGTLAIDSLDFLTPLGQAHAVKTGVVFTSLLPPVTADNQGVAIARIDWTLPLSAVNLHFGFGTAAIKLQDINTDIAQGHVAVDGFTINLADPGRLQGAAQLSGVALDALVTASNLSSKLKLTGKISGRVPFTLTPDGFRIVNGHVASDGAGRLSIDRSLWGQGDVAVSSNAVEDFAYQGLENLAFDSLTADLNSVAVGRLQIVLHIKGRSDPPKPQTANIAITDLVNGTAFQKPIPLPSGTPIDLTLDTSLNFDELLKSYAEAWSKTLSPAGPQGTARGATQ